ncbi:transposase [Flexistipes sinusarabici]|uniref:transposase n=1 Tax=Flexistipes sinusarabici TaxID=2352 RepID=UPI00235704ED|nr:transposase [Flexistipes sinusarabici]
MARTKRFKINGDVGYYHVISRTVGGEFLLGDVEKEKLMSVIMQFSSLYFVSVIGYCIMDNHFHLLVKTLSVEDVNNEELKERLSRHNKNISNEITESEILRYKEKLTDISEYVKSIKMTFSRWYNKRNNRRGYLWGDRFKSVLVESGESLLNMLAYIDLNPVRAKICSKPEEYRWCSFSDRLAKKNDDFLSFEGTEIDKIEDYVSFVYGVGKLERKSYNGAEKGKISEDSRPEINLWRHRIRYFSDTLVIGSKGFIEYAYKTFEDKITKKERKAHKIPINLPQDLYSIRRLNSI